MPLTRENRELLEPAIINYLRLYGEATSKDIYNDLKLRGFLALRGTKQVSMICLGFERKGALLSRTTVMREKLRRYKKKVWRINPNFYKEHQGGRMFTFPYREPEGMRLIRKRRMSVIR